MITNNHIALARSQEQQKLFKILVCGIGCSLILHGIAAIAFNLLPQQSSDNSVEVTLIDSSELPPELQPSPTPSVKTTPTPIINIKPDTQTPSVIRVIPQQNEPQQQSIKKATQGNWSIEPIINTPVVAASSPSSSNSQGLNSSSKVLPNKIRQENEQNYNKNLVNTQNNNNQQKFPEKFNSTKWIPSGLQSSGKSFRPGLGGKNVRNHFVSPPEKESLDYGGSISLHHPSNDKFPVTQFPDISGGFPPNPVSDSSNSSPLPGDHLGKNHHPQKVAGAEEVLASKHGQGGRSGILGVANTNNRVPYGAKNSGEGSNGMSNGTAVTPDALPPNSLVGKAPAQHPVSANPGIQKQKGNFGIELACIKNCKPKYSRSIREATQVSVQIELNNSGQVITAKISQSCNVPVLDNFAVAKFGEMTFDLPPGFDQRTFIVRMDFIRK
jgi:hypothetical protein